MVYLEVVSKCFMAEMVNKKKTMRVHPAGYLLQKILVVLHMLFQELSQFKRADKVHAIQKGSKTAYLKHFNGKYPVIGCFHIKSANICNNDLHILELKIPIDKEKEDS